MSKSIYIATCDANSGKSLVALGMMTMLLGRTPKVGYLRPIIDDRKEGILDNHIATILSHFNLDRPYEECYVFTRSEYVMMEDAGREGELLDRIIGHYKEMEERYDFVLIEGTDFSGEGATIELGTNITIAQNLQSPVILVTSGVNKELEEFIAEVGIAYGSFREKEVEVLAVIANKIQPENLEMVQEELMRRFGAGTCIHSIPMLEKLNNPTIREVLWALEGHCLMGDEQAHNQVSDYVVGAMQLRNFLTFLKEDNSIIITPGDRADVILGSIQANNSSNYPKISGIVLTGGLQPEASVMQLIEGLENIPPIIATDKATFEITYEVGNIRSNIYHDNKEKIRRSIDTFNQYVEIKPLTEKLDSFRTDAVTPRMFQYQLLQKAKAKRKHIVLPEGEDARILRAAGQIAAMNLVDLTLLGNPEEIRKTALELKIDLKDIPIINPENSAHLEDFADTLFELRKHKNITRDTAADLVRDVSYFGTMMVYKGLADGMVSGAAHTTQHTIRPALQIIKTKPGVSTVSSVFFMCLEDRVLVFGDCAVNPNPNAEQLAEIAVSSSHSSEAFGIEPKVAMLSYSSGTSGKGSEVEKVRAATELVRKQLPNLKIEGPLQYDAAVSKVVASNKLPGSEVAGQATVFIFPDLNTGNNTYKAVQHETGTVANRAYAAGA